MSEENGDSAMISEVTFGGCTSQCPSFEGVAEFGPEKKVFCSKGEKQDGVTIVPAQTGIVSPDECEI